MPDALSDNQLARAGGANPRWRAKLGDEWPSDAAFGAANITPLTGPGDFDFAEAIAAYQAANHLGFDGICGKLTSAHIRNVAPSSPKADPILIVAGREHPAPGCRVVPFTDPNGLSFVEHPIWRKRDPRSRIDLFVLHHDGCRSSRQCFDVLLERRLSVHLMVDRDGTIYQALDLLSASAFHAGPANARSVGVEICNPERVDRNDPNDPRPVGPLEVTNAGGAGARRPVLGFYPQQVEAVTNLARAITVAFGIPFALPKASSAASVAGVTRGFDARVAGGQFRGVCGHYHLKESKIDPGVTLWPALIAAGAVAS